MSFVCRAAAWVKPARLFALAVWFVSAGQESRGEIGRAKNAVHAAVALAGFGEQNGIGLLIPASTCTGPGILARILAEAALFRSFAEAPRLPVSGKAMAWEDRGWLAPVRAD
jgi:hypothetical protein